MKIYTLFSIFVALVYVDGRYQLAHQNNAALKQAQEKSDFFDAYLFEHSANSSFGFSMPLFSVTVPGYGREHPEIDQFRTVNFGNTALLGMVVLGFMTLTFPFVSSRADWLSEGIGSIFPGRSGRSRRDLTARFLSHGSGGLTEYVILRVDRALDDVPNFPTLHPKQCLKRAICEAHHNPERYGLLAKLLTLIYPPYMSDEDSPSHIVSSYEEAARLGRNGREGDCTLNYDSCMISIMELYYKTTSIFYRGRSSSAAKQRNKARSKSSTGGSGAATGGGGAAKTTSSRRKTEAEVAEAVDDDEDETAKEAN